MPVFEPTAHFIDHLHEQVDKAIAKGVQDATTTALAALNDVKNVGLAGRKRAVIVDLHLYGKNFQIERQSTWSRYVCEIHRLIATGEGAANKAVPIMTLYVCLQVGEQQIGDKVPRWEVCVAAGLGTTFKTSEDLDQTPNWDENLRNITGGVEASLLRRLEYHGIKVPPT